MAARPISISMNYVVPGAVESTDLFTLVYTVPAGRYAKIYSIAIINVTDGPRHSFQLSKRVAGKAGNFFLVSSAGADIILDYTFVLSSSDTLWFYSDFATTQITLSGEELLLDN